MGGSGLARQRPLHCHLLPIQHRLVLSGHLWVGHRSHKVLTRLHTKNWPPKMQLYILRLLFMNAHKWGTLITEHGKRIVQAAAFASFLPTLIVFVPNTVNFYYPFNGETAAHIAVQICMKVRNWNALITYCGNRTMTLNVTGTRGTQEPESS